MKEYTDAVQTAHLIALGFPSPKSVSKLTLDIDMDTIPTFNYSIGELIKMLPPRTRSGGYDWDLDINHDYKFERWLCSFNPETQIGVATELVDALFNLIIKLKEEGVI